MAGIYHKGGKARAEMHDEDQPESFDHARAGLPDVAPDASVIWKPLRRLLQYDDGSPIDPVTVLSYKIGDGTHLPFASVARTRGNRLILWPPSGSSERTEFADGQVFPIHHVTLELANGRTHFTRFDVNGRRLHEDRAWNLAIFEGGLQLWLLTAFSVKCLERQAGALEQTIRMPTTDAGRREAEFRRYAGEMTQVSINTPPIRGDYLVTVIHILPDSAALRGPIQPQHFPMGTFWNEWIEGWPDGDNFQLVPTGTNIGGINLILLTAAPLGRLKGDCFLGAHHHGRNRAK